MTPRENRVHYTTRTLQVLHKALWAYQCSCHISAADAGSPDGTDYVAVYISDVLVFSRTLEDHLNIFGELLKGSRKA